MLFFKFSQTLNLQKYEQHVLKRFYIIKTSSAKINFKVLSIENPLPMMVHCDEKSNIYHFQPTELYLGWCTQTHTHSEEVHRI